ncbi:carboxylesterase family protein [Streptomyces sp. NPDC059783]|uniref:carboxylesterase family protein n=1 Tax=Streptomyces sp. NPDC059783 TaxID=3346944 RepID=UPI0036556566
MDPFGGDPDLVTVGGQADGAGSVAALLMMAPASGLYRRTLTHSVPGLHCTPALAKEATAALADRLGAAPTAASGCVPSPHRCANGRSGRRTRPWNHAPPPPGPSSSSRAPGRTPPELYRRYAEEPLLACAEAVARRIGVRRLCVPGYYPHTPAGPGRRGTP